MKANSNVHVVFGASGSLGSALVHELARRGKHVRAVNRSSRAEVPAGVELKKGDAMDASSTRKGRIRARIAETLMQAYGSGKVQATIGERDEALGEIGNIPSAETITTRELLTMAFEVAGEEARMRGTPSWLITGLGIFSPELSEVKEMLYEFEEPFVVDHSKYENAFGSEVTPHREALQKTLDWFRQRKSSGGS